MTDSNRPASRTLKSLTKREAAYLWVLNQQLQQAENWVLERLQKGLSASQRLCSQYDGAEAALDACVYCLRHPEHAAFDPETENVVAGIDANFLLMRNPLDALQTRWRRMAEHDAHFLSLMPACLLFQRLTLDVCDQDVAPLLTVGTLRIEIALRQEKLLRVGDMLHR